MSVSLLVKRLSEKAMLPVRGSEYAAGYDLFSVDEYLVPARGKALVKTGIVLRFTIGNCGSQRQLRPSRPPFRTRTQKLHWRGRRRHWPGLQGGTRSSTFQSQRNRLPSQIRFNNISTFYKKNNINSYFIF
jgi:hypothetical protein